MFDSVELTMLKYPSTYHHDSCPERKGITVPYKKGEVRLSEILKQLGAMEGGTGIQEASSRNSRRAPTTGAERTHANQVDPYWRTGVESPTASLGKAGRQLSWRKDPQLQDAVAKVLLYLQVQRDIYYPVGHPLSAERKSELEGFFSPTLLDRVRIVELKERKVANPWFYDEARAKGIENLPDISHKVAVTFLDVVVFNQKMTPRDLFHGLVHAAQVKLLGLERFAELFVLGFLQSRSYFLIPLKAHAFALDTRYAEDPQAGFSVDDEIRRWHTQGRY